MRNTPFPHRRSCLLIALLLLALPLAAQRGQIAKLRQQSAALDKQLKETERLINTNRRDVATQASNLRILNDQIARQQRHIRGIEAEKDTLEASLKTLNAQLKTLEADLAECQRRHQRAVMYMHRNRSLTSTLSFLLTAKDFRQMSRRMRYLSDYSKFQRQQAAIIQEKEAAVRQKRAEVTAVTAEKNEALNESRLQHEQLRQRENRQQELMTQLAKRQKELERTAAAQRQQRTNLNGRIEQLVRQEAEAERRRQIEAEKRRKAEAAAAEKRRQAEAARRKREQEAEARRASASKGKEKKKETRKEKKARKEEAATKRQQAAYTPPAPVRPSGGGLHGGLPMPITGACAITTHFGNYSTGGVTLSNKGIDITGHSGAQARAVAEGEVSYIFSMNGFQNVIVRHGSYMTVYCNLSSVSVRKGQRVSARQTLGAVGRDAAGNCTLHFQIWRDRNILNPESWLAR